MASNRRLISAGDRFGRYTVVSNGAPDRHRKRRWICVCDCGAIRSVTTGDLAKGTMSCGCFSREVTRSLFTTHGMSKTREYKIWKAIKTRCFNENDRSYARYGGAGVTICDQWKNSFESFISYIGAAPSSGHSIDRYPNLFGNYEPGNIRWATDKEQSLNRRNVIWIEHKGETLCAKDWARRIGMDNSLLCKLIKKQVPEEVLARLIAKRGLTKQWQPNQ